MIRRPKPGEDEEEILRLQQEFLKDKNFQPAAQVVNLRKTEHQTIKRASATTSGSRKLSKYAQIKGITAEKRSRIDSKATQLVGDIIEKNISEEHRSPELDDDRVNYPSIIPSVLGDIVEKNYNVTFNLDNIQMPSTGFPVVTKYNTNIKFFAKNIYTHQPDLLNKYRENKMDIDQALPTFSSPVYTEKPLIIPPQSYILSSTDADSIHKENVEILAKMSEEDILQEQKTLLSSLNPKLVDFVKAMKKQLSAQKTATNIQAMNNKELEDYEMSAIAIQTYDETNSTKSNDYLWENDVLTHPEINQWLHFEELEKDKLEWITSVKNCKMLEANEPYEARFDFKGNLLPYTLEYTEKTKTLFHHGEDPDRPGYSITELIELSRSTVIQQRIMALNTIAGILEYYMAGIYKDILEIPLSKIFFVLRIAMDENKIILLEPALKAMRNLLFNRVDEACLDSLLGFEEGSFQPYLENDKSEIGEMDSKETEFNDFHLAEIDLISAAIRTDILQRLYYVLETLKPSFNSVQYALQILTRLSRDSSETVNKIIQTTHLMNTIIMNFVPATSLNFSFNLTSAYIGKPVLAALKLMRILSSDSQEICELLIMKYKLLMPLSSYVSSGVDGTYGLRLQIEALCIFSNLLHYGLGTENALSLCPLIINTLYNHVHATDIFIESSVLSATHAAVILQFFSKLLSCDNLNLDNLKHEIYPLLKEGVQKWLMQTACFETYTAGHLRLLCSALDCCKTVLTTEKVALKFLNDTLMSLSSSKGFQILMSNVETSSNLLSNFSDRDMNFNKNLKNLGGSIITPVQKVIPILNVVSPIPFLVSLYKLLNVISDKEIATIYINVVKNYLQKISKKALSLCSNWFTRMEVEFIYNIVKLSIKSDISDTFKDLVYVISNTLCFILRIDKPYNLHYLFNEVIFNRHWFTTERLFSLLSLANTDDDLTAHINVEDIKICYNKVININQTGTKNNITIKNWQDPILPRDWIYLPILSLYSSNHDIKSVSGIQSNLLMCQETSKNELFVRCSLEWIFFSEITFPDLLNDIDVTDRFCRILCVFLCDSSLFLDKKINMFLRQCTKLLYKSCDKFNFDKQLTGLSNFQDFYTQILEQFQSVSYGDHTFASCVLVPLAQIHNVKWRKLLWSEYAGCLRALDCPENELCYSLENYFYPEETDETLLKSYFRALSSNLLKPDSIVYKIAQHHVQKFQIRNNIM